MPSLIAASGSEDDILCRKANVRRAALARRKGLSEAFRDEVSQRIASCADQLELANGAIVSGFWPIRDEIDPRPLLDRLRQRRHTIALPVVTGKRELVFRQYDPESLMVEAGFGTLAPGPEAPEVLPDVLLVPLAAFDGAGRRIGYGKGFYDNAIKTLQLRKPVRCIGLAFATQEVETVPAEPHDKTLDAIVTENGYQLFPSDLEAQVQ